MSDFSDDIFEFSGSNGPDSLGSPDRCDETSTKNKKLKKELLDVFRKFGYLGEGKDYEIRIKTTSGNIAWINIKGVETIK